MLHSSHAICLTPILVNSVESNLVNHEALVLIDSVAALEDGFGSTGGLQKVCINRIDYVTCNDLCDEEIVDCSVSVCLAAIKIVAKATPAIPFRSGKHEPEGLDRRDDLRAVE
jgi:hypothetical protein